MICWLEVYRLVVEITNLKFRYFPDAKVAYLAGDRKFVGKQWLAYFLIESTIPFRLIIRKSAPPASQHIGSSKQRSL